MEHINLKLTLKFDHPINAYALVMGGYFPLTLSHGGVLLIDRNVLSAVSSVAGCSKRHDAEANKWWLSFLNRREVIINPVICAMEGEEQAIPTYNQFCALIDDASIRISKYLPKAQVVSFDDEVYASAYEVVKDLLPRYQSERDFLIHVAPLIACSNPRSQLRDIEQQIYLFCSRSNLDIFSLPVIAALSCLYESNDGGIMQVGRKIIKPTEQYGAKQAHNAICDLRSLELLAAGNGLGIGNLTFCTRDKALAAFWCSLRFKPAVWHNEEAKINLSLDNQLFPALNDQEMSDFYGRMVQHASS